MSAIDNSDPFRDSAPSHHLQSEVPTKDGSKMPAPTKDNHTDIREAVRDTVTVRGSDRTKMSRSHTGGGGGTGNSATRPAGALRSLSQDSGPQEKAKNSKGKSKKGSQHADVIDRLDFTGVGPMFHHDGPFDACAPSRNRSNRAPMAAWVPRADGNNDSAYPKAVAPLFSYEYEHPKKKVDAIAEAWGMHEPEPFEDFSAGGGRQADTPTGSIYNGRTGRKDKGEIPEVPRVTRHAHKSSVPPPQPIFTGEPDAIQDYVAPSSPRHAPTRSKSFMQRIRKMRETPNVPPNYDDPPVPPISPTIDERRPATYNDTTSTAPDKFVYIDKPRRNADGHKALPATPRSPDGDEYFSDRGGASATNSPGLGRKASLMKRMRVVVRGNK